MKGMIILSAVCLFVVLSLGFIGGVHGDEVNFPDPNLEAAIREAINKPEGPITDEDLAGLTELDASDSGISDLTGIEHCVNLEELYLRHNEMTSINPIGELTNLRKLDLSENRIVDISPLSRLTNLEWLNLWINQIDKISPLSGLTNLQWLSLGHNRISDISPLAGLTNLQQLWLDGNQISDISPLSSLVKLQQLWLAINQVDDLSPLRNLTNLRSLNLGSNRINDLSSLSNLTHLEGLNLWANRISDLTPLSNLTNLKGLTLNGNKVSDLSPLSNLTNLQKLRLENNQISDLGPLGNLNNLRWLELSNNQISDLSPLSSLTNLELLYLDSNQITDISPLAELTKIGEGETWWIHKRGGTKVHLGLANNRITDISPLVNNPGIGEGDGIDLKGNPLSIESLRTLVPELKRRGVMVIGAPIIVPDVQAPRALILDGDEDYVRIADSPTLYAGAFTLEVWFNFSRLHSGWNTIIANDEYEVHIGGDGVVISWDNAAWDLRGTTILSPNKWYHLAFVNDGSQRWIYLDGKVEAYSDSASPVRDVDQELWIGNDPQPPTRYFVGLIDEVRIWNYARTQEEIQATMNTTLNGDEPGLVAYWSFDDGTPRDLSANGNHGTLHGDAGIIPLVDSWPPPKIGDVSGNGVITAYDAALILQFVVGIIDHLPGPTSVEISSSPHPFELRIPEVKAHLGDELRLPILIDNANGLFAGGLILRYDPNVLKAEDVLAGALSSGTYWKANVQEEGVVRIAFASEEEIRGSGTLFEVRMKSVGEGDSEIKIERADLFMNWGMRVEGGLVRVIPGETVLLPNYPNPFNPETWIPFQLAKEADVVIRIYDVRGNLIRTLDLGRLCAGYYTSRSSAAYWDGRNEIGERVASGVYVYQMVVGDKGFVRRMVILK